MRSNVVVLIIFLTLVTNANLVAQAFDEFNWNYFPKGEYHILLYFDVESVANDEFNFVERIVMDELLADEPIFVDAASRKKIRSLTFALVETIISERSGFEVKRLKLNESSWLDWNYICVYELHDSMEFLNDLVKNGIATKTRARFGKRYLYKAEHPDANQMFFFYITHDGKLLTAKNRQTLVAMVQAGMGKAQRMLDEPGFDSLPGLVPDSPLWYIITVEPARRMLIEQRRIQGIDEKIIAHDIKEMEESERFVIGSLTLADTPEYSEIYIFGDEQRARGYDEEEGVSGLGSVFDDSLIEKTTRTLDGSRIVLNSTYDLKKTREFYERKFKADESESSEN